MSDANKRISRKISRRGFLRGAGAVVGSAAVSGILSACGGAGEAATATTEVAAPTQAPTEPTIIVTETPAPASAGAQYGGKLTWAIEQDVANVIPFGAVNTSNHWGKEHVYESLVAWDRNLNVVPALAETWETPDDKTWIWHLRKGVKFHNGEEVTGEAVKYSMALQQEPPPPGETKNYYPAIESVEVIDDYTVQFNMTGPDPTVLGYLAWGRYSPIIPVDAYDRWNLITEAVGSGPFKLVQYVANDRLEYVKYADYWDPTIPYLDEMVIKILPDENARIAALRTGAVDGCFLLADSVPLIKDDPNITVLRGLFSAPRVLQFTLKNQGKPWEDIRVRQAINFAIDRKDLIDKVFAGEAVLSGVVPPGYGDWFLPPAELEEKWLYYDVDKSRGLMADAGYQDGFDITLYAIANHDASKSAEVVKEHLKEINVNVEVISEEIGTFAQRVGEGNFDWCSTGRGMRHDITGYVKDFCMTDQGTYAKWFNNGEGYRNAESVELYNLLAVNLDHESRVQQALEIQRNVMEDVPHVYLCQPYWFHGVRSNVKDMYASFTNFYPGLRTAWLEA